MFFLLSLLASPALAVPGQFTHQGRILDGDGAPLEGERTISFRLMDDVDGGAEVWSEDLPVMLDNGFYVAILGQDEEGNPLDVSVLDQAPLWLEVAIEDEPPMSPRSPVNSVPYAQMAGLSEGTIGGAVDASEVTVSGTPVIDGDGRWVGAPVQWDELEGVPAGFIDGVDDDTVTADTVLSASEVMGHVDGATLDLGVDSTLAGTPIATVDDTIASKDCIEGDVLRWDSILMEWTCTTDLDPGTTIGGDSVLTTAAGSAVPSGMIAFFAASDCPTGWSEFTALQGRFILGTPADGSSGSEVGSPLTDEGSLTTSSVVAHAHNVAPPLITTSTTDLTHSHDMSHSHEVDPPVTTTSDTETSGSSGCTSVNDKWNNSGGCHWPSSCSASYTVAACGSGSGTPHNHSTDIAPFASADSSVGTTAVTEGTHEHTVESPAFMSDASGAELVDITPPYLQLMACIAP